MRFTLVYKAYVKSGKKLLPAGVPKTDYFGMMRHTKLNSHRGLTRSLSKKSPLCTKVLGLLQPALLDAPVELITEVEETNHE